MLAAIDFSEDLESLNKITSEWRGIKEEIMEGENQEVELIIL